MSRACEMEFRIIDTAEIQSLLPQRDPFLFVQSAKIFEDGHVEGHCSWPSEHPILSGHFPGLKIVPGVLMVEAAAQAAGIGVLRTTGVSLSTDVERLGVLNAIRRFTIHRPLFPDEVMQVDVRFDEAYGGKHAAKVRGVLTGSEEKIVTGELVLTLVTRDQLVCGRRSE